jgi:ribosomal protein S18 acetylase RimI-like enzyme
MAVSHAGRVAQIHAAALPGDFLPSLGVRFLSTFYRAALESAAAFGFVQIQGDQASGFVLGSVDTSQLFRRVILRAAVPLAWAALPAVLRRPGLLARVAETFLYPQREASVPEKAELVVIAVDSQRRSQGSGQALVQALDEAFLAQGVQSYKVTVLQSNPGANRFYQRLGFCPAGEFQLYGKRWNLYTRTLR